MNPPLIDDTTQETSAGALLGSVELTPFQPGNETQAPPAEVIDWEAIAPRGWYARHGRRLFDLVLLVVLLPATLPPMILVALANLVLYRDPRRVLFVQERVGWRGRVFRIYKFRTMREVGESHMSSWSSGADHLRVTRFGRFLRNMHLDELPQLINVLKGEMGFIGPRPEMVEIETWAQEHVPGFTRRLRIRPGITGLAQITQGYVGRSAEAYREKLAIGERYLAELSFKRDLGIVLRTVVWMLRGRGWHWRG